MKAQYLLFSLLFLLTYFTGWSQGSVTTFEIKSLQLKTTKKIWVYLPYNYKTSKKISAIYMHDAQNLSDTKTAFACEWRIDETLNCLKANLKVVGIEHGMKIELNN